jgi:hypothetical protein
MDGACRCILLRSLDLRAQHFQLLILLLQQRVLLLQQRILQLQLTR